MKCHYCDMEAVTVVGEYLKRHVCALCAEACGHATAYVESIFTPDVLDRIFDGPAAPTKRGRATS